MWPVASSRPGLVFGAVAWVAVAALVLAARTTGTGVVPADVGEIAGGGALDVAFHVRPAVDGGRRVLERAATARRGQPGWKHRCRAAAVRGASLRAAAVRPPAPVAAAGRGVRPRRRPCPPDAAAPRGADALPRDVPLVPDPDPDPDVLLVPDLDPDPDVLLVPNLDPDPDALLVPGRGAEVTHETRPSATGTRRNQGLALTARASGGLPAPWPRPFAAPWVSSRPGLVRALG